MPNFQERHKIVFLSFWPHNLDLHELSQHELWNNVEFRFAFWERTDKLLEAINCKEEEAGKFFEVSEFSFAVWRIFSFVWFYFIFNFNLFQAYVCFLYTLENIGKSLVFNFQIYRK